VIQTKHLEIFIMPGNGMLEHLASRHGKNWCERRGFRFIDSFNVTGDLDDDGHILMRHDIEYDDAPEEGQQSDQQGVT
jgi:hypothetical protein